MPGQRCDPGAEQLATLGITVFVCVDKQKPSGG